MQIDVKEFRKALGQFATGVALITARDREGLPVGITVSSFNSVSIDPPLILFSVDRRTLSLPALLAAEGYAVNILDQSQESISAQFAKAMQKNWQTVAHTPGHAEAPLIEGALAQFECSPYAHHDGGDHIIFIGRVVQFRNMHDGIPLLFFRGKYHSIRTQDSTARDF